MKYTFKLVLFAAVAVIGASCCRNCPVEDGYDLRFNQDGRFRILQITDSHLNGTRTEDYANAKEQMVSIVESEKPDLVILTGDVVTCVPAEPWWADFMAPLDEKNIPFVVVYGNHDRERELSEYELAQAVTLHSANINALDSFGLLSDMALKIKSADGSRVGAVLYCMDSYDYPSVAGFDGYGWIAGDRIEWYREQSRSFAEANYGYPVPSYSFFHIPLCEYKTATDKELIAVGKKGENECSGSLNSGMFVSMLECGDVHGVFVGHDHVDDYIAPYAGIALGYGRVSAFNTTYGTEDQPHGLRIIDIKEGDYGFDTYIALNGGGRSDEYRFDVPTDLTVRPAVSAEIALSEGERLLDVPENGHWTFRKTRGRGYEVAVDDVIVCPEGKRSTGVIALEGGLHKLRVTAVTEDATKEPFHLAWRRAGSGIMREIPEDKYVK